MHAATPQNFMSQTPTTNNKHIDMNEKVLKSTKLYGENILFCMQFYSYVLCSLHCTRAQKCTKNFMCQNLWSHPLVQPMYDKSPILAGNIGDM